MSFSLHYGVVWTNFLAMSLTDTLKALATMTVIGVFGVFLHECGHLFTARAFGVRGRIRIFVRRGKSKVWFLSVLGALIDDEDFHALKSWQRRLVILGGPAIDVSFSLALLFAGGKAPGAAWLSGGLAMLGAVYLPCSAMNIVPMRALRNDGWLMVRPGDAI
ncbi:Peptidase family M50 [Caballeronia terrestris]|uniref:Peptidase family M50 n=1 Tax=Caballeronia terrestris TaxID=1226301 RepID=A0A158KV98_9BURK|nr:MULTISPECIES: site-2 protease family protein [Caballeronia]SAL06110.1 Peptidase family M50 [Caballeronia arationis]SAL85017.1 Peptidase family M50 [Caballeronia terrestris]